MITYADFLALPEPNAAHLLEAYELDSEHTEESLDLFLLETLLAETRECGDDEGSWQVMLRKLPQSVFEVLLSKITVAPGRVSVRTAPDTDAEYGYPQYLVHRCELAHPERPPGQQDPRCACPPAGDERVYLLRTPVVADSYTAGSGTHHLGAAAADDDGPAAGAQGHSPGGVQRPGLRADVDPGQRPFTAGVPGGGGQPVERAGHYVNQAMQLAMLGIGSYGDLRRLSFGEFHALINYANRELRQRNKAGRRPRGRRR